MGTDRPLVARALPPAAAFLGVAAAGAAGFVVLAGVGPVEATFWLLDPTGIELHFERHAGPERLTKAYAVVVTVGLVLSSLWAGETVLSAAFGGQIARELSLARDRRRIMDTEDHVIVCGYGMFGRSVARRLAEADREVVVVESDGDESERARRDGHLVVTGDARRESVLREAGVDRARTTVAAVDDSNVNIQVAIAASQLSPGVRLFVRVGDETYESLARRAGADEVVIPEVMSARSIADDI